MANGDDKALVASSEFDPSAFIKGMDAMTASITKLNEQEQALQKQLEDGTKALNANKTAMKANQDQIANLDKQSKTYEQDLQKLNQQQAALKTEQTAITNNLRSNRNELREVNNSAKVYKDSLTQITTVARQLRQGGGNLFDVATLNQQVQTVNEMAGTFRDIFQGRVDTSELDRLEEQLAGTSDEFEQLGQIIDFIEDKIGTLDPDTQEFQDLNQVLETGRQVLEAYGQTQDETAEKSVSMRTRLAALKKELQELEAAGGENTQRFEELSIEAARLEDQIGDTNARVRALASDTKNLDFGIGAIRGIASAFGVAEGAAALFGVQSQQVQESIQRLNAILVILNGLQEIQNLLSKQNIVQIVGQNIATKAYAVSQRVLAATLGSTAAASKALNVALLTTGIGALIAAIGAVIVLMDQWIHSTEEMTQAQENLNTAIAVGIQDNENFLAGLEQRARARILEAEIAQAAAERISETDEQQLARRIANNRELRETDIRSLQEQVAQARRFADSRRSAFDEAHATLDAIRERRITFDQALVDSLNKTIDDFNKADTTAANLENQLDLRRLQNQRDRIREDLELKRARLKAEEDFLKRLDDLRKRLLDAQNAAARQDAQQLAKTAQDNLQFELRAIDREVRKGVLTRDQGNLLKNLLRQINEVELTDELKDFNRKVVDTQRQIEEQIFDLRLQSATERANLLRDALAKEAEIIALENRQQVEALNREREDLLRGVRDAFDQGLISESAAQQNAERIEEIYVQLLQNLATQTRRKQEELANATFQRSLQLVRDLFQPSFTNLTEQTTQELQVLATQFTRNRISFERYQRELTEIMRRESRRRVELQITENEQLLRGVQDRIALENDPARREELQREVLRLREQLAQLRRQLAAADVEDEQAQDQLVTEKIQRIARYVEAIGAMTNQVIAFWQQANEAEQRALERSIQLQETRVEAATRIAERGNAEYLRLEEDRLNELRVKQENAARRQLAINAVLQTSQALVAFTTALAQGIATGGPLGGIAIATAVLGLLASGYAIVQSLQNDSGVQQFKGGTKFVRRKNGEPAGDDTVPAMLTEGEGVVPRDRNREYSDTVAAVIDRTVPPEDLNAFVNSYQVNRRRFPQLAGDRIGEAVETHTSYGARLAEISMEHTYLMRETNERLDNLDRSIKNIGVSFNIDRHGMIAMLFKGINQAKIDSKA
jgi:hypothetical protein